MDKAFRLPAHAGRKGGWASWPAVDAVMYKPDHVQNVLLFVAQAAAMIPRLHNV